ncbi:hypothetical protein [Parasphingorhabdus sp.]|uniref:hypothetical protein n=1 Tax=Parasphingorhabdus sp. TaxID=2709688 RepID=UPI003BB1A62F
MNVMILGILRKKDEVYKVDTVLMGIREKPDSGKITEFSKQIHQTGENRIPIPERG